ncbi:MAG: low molecular weight protein arginine phosphatase [Firmicutes bacterium]|nr:low molecular weight protein arginine phosphatase [Bacillota bacterium]
MKILFVCEANICRSAMAEALGKHLLRLNSLKGTIKSAGVRAYEGSTMSDLTKKVLKDNKVRAHSHKSTRLSDRHLKRFDYILTATNIQKVNIVSFAKEFDLAEYINKVYTLGEFAGSGEDVKDPYGYDYDSYAYTFNKVAPLVKKAIEKITGYNIYV